MPLDPLALSKSLIRCPSVTPEDAGALDVLEDALKGLGFQTRRMPFGGDDGTEWVDNLYARFGTSGENFCFAGHTDVVPVGDTAAWTRDPFGAQVADGRLWGRGATDMKCAIACFAAAVSERLPESGSVSFLITGDEEGVAVNGTVKVLDWLKDKGERLDACLVGEPSNPSRLGEMMKVGRRGSMNGVLTVKGVQGHVAYPHRTVNPIPRLVGLLAALDAHVLDQGTEHFQASNLEITSIDVGNQAVNVIPAKAAAMFNIRFNDAHGPVDLEERLRGVLAGVAGDADWNLETACSGVSFVTPPGRLSDAIAEAVKAETGLDAELSTSGGTSDARFIKDHCPVVEFGMVGETAHKVDENVPVDDVYTLTRIYRRVLDGWFGA